MRLNLGCGKDIRSGYLNIDKMPQSQIQSDEYTQGDIQCLDWLTEDDTVEEILVIDCIEYLPNDVIKAALTNWANKLSSGGTIKILVPDCYSVAKAFVQGQFNLQEYFQVTFGTQKNNDNRLSLLDTATLLSILEEIGLSISLKRYEGVAIYVEAVK